MTEARLFFDYKIYRCTQHRQDEPVECPLDPSVIGCHNQMVIERSDFVVEVPTIVREDGLVLFALARDIHAKLRLQGVV